MDYKDIVSRSNDFQKTYPPEFQQYLEWRIFPMRKAMLFLATFALAGSLLAADPSTGTWKLNPSKSTDPDLKELTLVKRALNNGMFELVETGTQKDGKQISNKFTHPQQGGVVTPQSKPVEGELSVVTLIDPADFYVTIMQKGKQVQIQHVVVNKDGKSMKVTSKGIDDKGKPFETIDVFDKQ
jgi:hypothetical protein